MSAKKDECGSIVFPRTKICIQDSNGKVYFLQIGNGRKAKVFGIRNKKSKGGDKANDGTEVITKAEPAANTSLDGYDPTTGEVLGPVGDPLGPGNGSVVIREINSEREINQAWFTTKQDKSALTTKGIKWKQGAWSSEETALLNDNIASYCRGRGIDDPAEIIFDMSKDERKDFYRCVSRGLRRPLFSVYRRVLRIYDVKNHIGRYTEEEVARLRLLRAKYGTDWALIGARMGRSASSVKDRCRLLNDSSNSGKWTDEEEERLTKAVHAVAGTSRGTSVSSNLPWPSIAACVKTRTEKQCRTKWLNYLNWKQAGGAEWTRAEDIQLVDKISSGGWKEESAVDWEELASGWAAARSPQWLRTKWWTLKKSLRDGQLFTSLKAMLKSLRDLHSDREDHKTDSRAANSSHRKSSAAGNDFWGVGEDSNGAASTSSLVNGAGSDVGVELPPLSIAPDFPSHLLVDAPTLQLAPAAVDLHLSSGAVEVPPLQLAADGMQLGCVVTSAADSLTSLGTRKDALSPSMESTDSRDLVFARSSQSPIVDRDDGDDDDRRTFVVAPGGRLIPFTESRSPQPTRPQPLHFLLQNVDGQRILVKEDSGNEGILSNAAQDDLQVHVSSVNGDEMIRLEDSSDITDASYILVDGELQSLGMKTEALRETDEEMFILELETDDGSRDLY